MNLSENKVKYRRFLWCCLAAAFVGMGALVYTEVKKNIPDEIQIFANRETDWDEIFDNPFVTYDAAVEVSQNGSYHVGCKLFGIFPLKTVKVTTIEKQNVYASGAPVGIYMETNGVLVIDSGEIRGADGISQSPAEHIIQPGDYIRKVNGQELQNKKQLIRMVSENHGEPIKMEVMRHEEMITLALTPMQTEDGSYKLGIWVRDNIQGIGTMTFVDGEGNFAALGHGISDVDTGERLDISMGDLYSARILSVQKGVSGSPGELRGVIDYQDSLKMGTIMQNTSNGITGKLKNGKIAGIHRENYEIGLKQELRTEKAQILCDVGDGVKEYEIEIVKINWNVKDSNKSFAIHVTDPRLLERTGGIVQGMSGSPILQNGKLVGAVTHVFVNDPTMGYGIFVETMLEETGKQIPFFSQRLVDHNG